MAFTRSLSKPAANVWLKDPADLARMPDTQFNEERKFWEDVQEVGGFFQIELGEFVLSYAITPLQQLRELRTAPETPRLNIEPARFRQTLASLAFAHLLRKFYGFEGLERGSMQQAHSVSGIDFDLKGGQPLAYLHERVGRVRRFMPVYDNAAKGAWYEDETLIVRALHPAKPTGAFRETTERVLDGTPFDPAEHVTLRPHLKLDYIQH